LVSIFNSKWVHDVAEAVSLGSTYLHCVEAVTHLLIIASSTGFLLWLKHWNPERWVLFCEYVTLAWGWYLNHGSLWALRYTISFEGERMLRDAEREDLRADSISLLDLKHKMPRLAHFRILDRLTGREVVRLAAVEVLSQIATGQNTNMLDDPKIIKARLHASAVKLMSVNLSRYLVLEHELVIPNTADLAYALYSRAHEDRVLLTPFF